MTIYTFPNNLGSSYRDFIRIATYEYVTLPDPQIIETASSESNTETDTSQPSESTETESANDTGDASASETESEAATANLPTLEFSRATTGNAVERFIKGTPINIFYLPMPSDINFTDGQSWEAQNVGAMGLYAGSLIKALTKMDSANLAASVSALAEAGLSEYALRVLDNLTPSSFVTQQSAGMVINPYREQVFNGMQMRAFTFNYKFVPDNADDNQKLLDIIKNMRIDSLPETTKSNTVIEEALRDESGELPEGVNEALDNFDNSLEDRWFKVPKIFEIKFIRNNVVDSEEPPEIKELPKIKPCICKSISVNYTPDGVWATRTDGKPVAIEVEMSFEEIEIVVSQDVSAGY